MRLTRNRYFRRLLEMAVRYKVLLGISISASALNLVLAFIIPWLIGSAIDRVIAPDWVRLGADAPPTFESRVHWLFVLVIIGIVTALLFGVVNYVRGHYAVTLGNRIIADLRMELFDHLQRLSLHFYAKERTGSIMSRLIHDIQQVGNLINGGILLVAMDLVQTLVAAGLLLMISWKLTIACIFVMPLYVLTFYITGPKIRRASERVMTQISKMSGNVQERLVAIALVKTNDGEARERLQFEQDTEEHLGRVTAESSVAHLGSAISETLVHLGTVIIIGYGSYLALRRDHMSAGDLTRFLGYMGLMYGPIRRFADLNNLYQSAMAALDRVFRVLDITPKIRDRHRASAVPPECGDVSFESVRFRYEDDSDESRVSLDDDVQHPRSERWILDDLNFRVTAGQRTALVGPSGSGKTTLVSLLPRLFDVNEGRVAIDGVDVRDYRLSSLRQSIAVVQQDSMIFSGTIRSNLLYGRPDATEDELRQASHAANADEFIRDLPGRYDTWIGERGVSLSGGQKQRLSIARALLKNPRMLILDEATSALDTESEALVKAALDNLMVGRTSFIIAHRLSTVQNVDRILVMDSGRLAESGTHDELLQKDGLYARLVSRQASRVAVPI